MHAFWIIIGLYISVGFAWVIWDFRNVLIYYATLIRYGDEKEILLNMDKKSPEKLKKLLRRRYAIINNSPVYASSLDIKTALLKIFLWPLVLFGLGFFHHKRHRK